MTRPGDEPAYPYFEERYASRGMSRRYHTAEKMMAAIIINGSGTSPEQRARDAFKHADALIAEERKQDA